MPLRWSLVLRIVCLGWGSLVWDPRELPIRPGWLTDGPLTPVEFVRQSFDGRITLVVEPNARPLAVLWAEMITLELPKATEALCAREGIQPKNCQKYIGSWVRGALPPRHIRDLPTWAEAREIDAVVWTALRPRFDRKDAIPSCDEVIGYLSTLKDPVRAQAKKYVERAPRQIQTEYRRRIEETLGWVYTE